MYSVVTCIRLVLTGKRIVEMWYVKSGGCLATAPINNGPPGQAPGRPQYRSFLFALNSDAPQNYKIYWVRVGYSTL